MPDDRSGRVNSRAEVAPIAYPREAADYEDAAIARALADVDLEHLQPLLDTTDRWDRRLNENEKQSLAFARVCLQRPQWLVVNGAFDALDPAARARIEALFAGPLSEVGLIDIGLETARDGFFKRKLHLITDTNGPTFRLVDPARVRPHRRLGVAATLLPPTPAVAACATNSRSDASRDRFAQEISAQLMRSHRSPCSAGCGQGYGPMESNR